MSTINYKSAVEAILFASGSSVDPQRISVALEISQDDAVHYLEELKNEYENSQRGITIVKLKDSYQMVSVKQYAPQILNLMDLKRNTPLSQAALEVLAVIAYNQPVTKSFVEQIRGVDCSGVIGSLTAKDLIEEKGRLELPGRPLIYGTTENFLRCFNISSIEELPPLPEDNQKEEQPADPTLFDEVNSAETVEGTVEEIIEQATAE